VYRQRLIALQYLLQKVGCPLVSQSSCYGFPANRPWHVRIHIQVLKKYADACCKYVEFSVGWNDIVERPWVAQEVCEIPLVSCGV
jgi:hypothetical protein